MYPPPTNQFCSYPKKKVYQSWHNVDWGTDENIKQTFKIHDH